MRGALSAATIGALFGVPIRISEHIVFTSLARACLLLVLGVCTASLGSGQPPEKPKVPTMQLPRPITPENPNPLALGSAQPVEQPKGIPPTKWTRPDYTAFPDLKPVPIERVKQPDGQIKVIEKWVPHPPIPELGANPTALRRVRFEQLHAGLDYIARIETMEAIVGKRFDDALNRTEYVAILRNGAELEEDLAKRVPWFEARVRVFKEVERSVAQRVAFGSDEPKRLSQARFARLEAEAELLELQAEIEKAKKK